MPVSSGLELVSTPAFVGLSSASALEAWRRTHQESIRSVDHIVLVPTLDVLKDREAL